MSDHRWLRGVLTLLFAVASAPSVARAHLSTYDDIWRVVLNPVCNNCHGPLGGSQSGGMIAGDDGSGTTERTWYNVLVGAKPVNGAAAGLGKLRVWPYEPWNSFLLDKLSAHLKLKEGRPMPFGITGGYIRTCPGAIAKIEKWILGGAPYSNYVPGDFDIGTVNCNALAQPAFTAPAAPTGGAQLLGETFTVASPTTGKDVIREGEHSTAMTMPAGVAVGRIEIVASPGTEYVVVSRGDTDADGNDVPLVVARGSSLDLALPDGVAVTLAAGQTITIRQRIRNPFWVKNTATGFYDNVTTGNVAVNLYPPASATYEAAPFLDATGTQALFVPPRLAGGTGGVWTSQAAVNGMVVGIWGDRTVIGATVADPAGGEVVEEVGALGHSPQLTSGYAPLAGTPAGALAYQCTHSNGFTNTNDNASLLGSLASLTRLVNRPMKFACTETASPVAAVSIPAGKPAIAGGSPPTDCERSIHDPVSMSPPAPKYDDSECTSSPVDSCTPANLVGGDGVNDGRCSLIGLVW